MAPYDFGQFQGLLNPNSNPNPILHVAYRRTGLTLPVEFMSLDSAFTSHIRILCTAAGSAHFYYTTRRTVAHKVLNRLQLGFIKLHFQLSVCHHLHQAFVIVFKQRM